MEDQQKPTNKIALNYGIILGFALILISVAVYAMGMAYKQDWKVSVISFLITVAIIALGIKKFKEANSGFLTLGQGLKTGMAVSLIGAILLVIYTLVFINFIEPNFVENMMEAGRQKMLDNPKLSEEQIDAALEMQKKFMGPFAMSAFILIWYLFIGFVISLISSLIMQKKQEE